MSSFGRRTGRWQKSSVAFQGGGSCSTTELQSFSSDRASKKRYGCTSRDTIRARFESGIIVKSGRLPLVCFLLPSLVKQLNFDEQKKEQNYA